MAVYNHDSREVQFKIVYCGAPLSGKTTNLIHIHERLAPGTRGDLVSIATARERTLFFDYLPVHATEIAGYRTRFQLYTVPGQKVYDETRQIVLRGADGIVFVADSDPERAGENLEALEATRDALRLLGRTTDRLPAVFQYNKRDLPRAMRPEEMDEALGVARPSFLACAKSGYNVFATLDAVSQEVLRHFHTRRLQRDATLPPRATETGSRPASPPTAAESEPNTPALAR